MDSSRKNKWAAFCFFMPSSLVLAYFIFYFATFTPPRANAQIAGRNNDYAIVPACPERVILVNGKPHTVGGIELTYLGMEADAIVMEVVILDLDPEYAYRRLIPRTAAEQGFQVAQQSYRLISGGRSKIKIVRKDR